MAAVCRDHDEERTLRIALLDEIRRHVDFDAYAWLLTDPDTEVGSAPLADVPALSDLPHHLPQLIRAKYLTTVNRWTILDGPAATLCDTTHGDREASLVWREVLSAHSVEDVASVVFRDHHGCWSWLDLWRSKCASMFTAADTVYLAAIAPTITEALRCCQASTFDHAESPKPARSGPAVLVLSAQLEVKAQTPETEAYLRTLIPPDGDRRPVPAGAYNVAAQLLALEAGVDRHEPSSRVHLHGGTWMTLRAARMDAPGPAAEHDIAVTIEPTAPAERLDLYARSHALTQRETDVLDDLAHGADTRTVAETLFLSQHTVQDHLKSIFAKTGTRNRRTLLNRVTGL